MKIHFIALGGSIMHSLAIALKIAGHQVSGSDDQIYDPARSKLEAHDLLPTNMGWDPDRIHTDLDAVILGMHAFADNPELLRAKELGLPLYSFPEFVYEQSRNKHRVVIAGSYGKTTITSMVMHVLEGVGKKFDYLVGAAVPGFENAVRLTEDAPVIVLEGDEYLASKIDPRPKFLLYQPHITVITGISWDHINVFPSEEIYTQQFIDLVRHLNKAADIIYNQDDPKLRKLIDHHAMDESFYLHPYKLPKYRLRNGQYEIKLEGERQEMRLIGRHNMSNLAAAWQVCRLLSVEVADFLHHMSSFMGAASRLETVYQDDDTLIIKDYAHAPAKVQATLEAARERYRQEYLIACVELHTFSSLNPDFLPQYQKSLDQADKAIVFVNPNAWEKRRLPALRESQIKAAFGRSDLIYVNSKADLQAAVRQGLKTNNVLLMMSSGNFDSLQWESLLEHS